MDLSLWTEMETMYTNDRSFVNHCQMMTQFDELPFSSCTYGNQPSHHDQPATFSSSWKEVHQKTTSFSSSTSNTASISFSNSLSATTTSKHYLKNSNMNSSVKIKVPSSETTINFSTDSLDFEDGQRLIQALGYGTIGDTSQKKSYRRTSLQAQEHILAERKRRERLSQRFIALSALIPNLMKLDKASVLREAINYIKQLEEQVKILEENATKYSEKQTTAVKRARSNGDYYWSFGSKNCTDQSLPKIEVKVSNGTVLISICCKRQSGIIKEIFSQVEKLNLSIINTSVLPFGFTFIHVTITAQMDHQLNKTAGYDANRIRVVIMKAINGQEEAATIHHKQFCTKQKVLWYVED